VLDVGCNAGYFSLDCKRRGAARVVGVDVNQGGHHDWLAQARFAAKELNLEIEYRNQDFFDVSDGPYDLVIFMGVLYHLEDPIGALAHLARLAREVAVVKSATTLRPGAVLEFRPGGTGQDPTSRWMPSARLIHERLKDVGFSRITRLRTFTNSYLAIARKN
jgi:tRNA (mo5U34)-methyltransferase